jgi:formyltetrahydrofolate synthetase
VPYDASKMKEWQIAEAAEENLPEPEEWLERLSLKKDEMIPYGRTPKLDFMKIIDRLQNRPNGKYIEVTAITPTPLGEGKSTTSIGLIEGLGKRGKNVGGALRQPSGGPTMNVKGTAAGGGNALLIPMTEFSMGLTGDMNDIMNAHNLAMVALTARMQHERNYDDEHLAETDTHAAAGHRPGPRRIQLDHGFLRPGIEKYYHRQRRAQRRCPDGIEIQHRPQFRTDGDTGHCQRPGGYAAKNG